MSRILEHGTLFEAEMMVRHIINRVTVEDVQELVSTTADAEEVYSAVRKALVEFPERI